MNKRAIVWTVAGIAFVALLVIALRDPSKANDVQLVNGVQPFSWQVLPFNSKIPDKQLRRYSLHMSYDEAVKSVISELGPGWTSDIYYSAAFFRSGAGEYVMVRRSRLVTEIDQPGGAPRTMAGNPAQLGRMLKTSVPDPSGWVTVTSLRKVGPFWGLLGKMRKLIGGRGKKRLMPYSEVMVLPNKGNAEQRVDVNAGTESLEGTSYGISFYEASR